MCWFIIHKTLQWLYLLCYYFVLVALFVVYICTWTLFSFYARPYVFYVLCNGVRMSHCIKGYLTWLDLKIIVTSHLRIFTGSLRMVACCVLLRVVYDCYELFTSQNYGKSIRRHSWEDFWHVNKFASLFTDPYECLRVVPSYLRICQRVTYGCCEWLRVGSP